MKRIADHRRLLGVTRTTNVDELKLVYRTLMKEWHPDRFLDEEDKLEAEEKSKQFIEAYHMLVSIAPETIEKALPQYTATVSRSTILNFSYEKQTLQLNFVDGSSYEYFEVPASLYAKLRGADNLSRFCRRHIYHAFVYRMVSKAMEMSPAS
jgi:hypothetical protein